MSEQGKAMKSASYDSPVGALKVWADNDGVTSLEWRLRVLPDLEPDATPDQSRAQATANAGVAQLAEYFEGNRRSFDLPLSPKISGFQREFGRALCDIPFGETRTYGDLARELDVSPQAIGQACGANPIAIIVPCHRVLAANGLGGFSGAGGVEAKVWLLKHEGAASLLI